MIKLWNKITARERRRTRLAWLSLLIAGVCYLSVGMWLAAPIIIAISLYCTIDLALEPPKDPEDPSLRP